jgi:hypothetical protein
MTMRPRLWSEAGAFGRDTTAVQKPEYNRQGRQDAKGNGEMAKCEQGRETRQAYTRNPQPVTRDSFGSLCLCVLVVNSYSESPVRKTETVKWYQEQSWL